MTDKQIKEREILYQGLNWSIGVDGCYINNTEKEPILNHLYEVALACKDKSEQLKRQERRCDMWENIAVDNGEIALKYQWQLDKLKEERDSYVDKYFLESQKVINLKKVLIEIKEIAEDFYLDGEHVKDKYLAQEILQKISGVVYE